MEFIAVIDTETNWNDEVMSIGIAIAEEGTFRLVDSRYYILDPEYMVGGMYSGAIMPKEGQNAKWCSRGEALSDIAQLCGNLGVGKLFAYNAPFDFRHLPELSLLNWYDIMRIAAYRQYNPYIPCDAPCCGTGRLKCNYGVEAMLRLLTGTTYSETHNALEDAIDELEIMRLLGHKTAFYEVARIGR